MNKLKKDLRILKLLLLNMTIVKIMNSFEKFWILLFFCLKIFLLFTNTSKRFKERNVDKKEPDEIRERQLIVAWSSFNLRPSLFVFPIRCV